jgi:undecaprenyl-diphosphatase
MGVLESIFYGLLQGIAEFLPISSSGHLALAHNFFGAEGEEYLAFDILLHLATLFAVLIMYRMEVWLIIKGFFTLMGKLFTGKIKKSPLEFGERLFLMLCVASIPLVPAALLSDYVEAASGISWLIGCLLIFNGCMLWCSDRLAAGKITLENAGWLRPFLVGMVQMAGVLSGISRSGSTLFGGLLTQLDREFAVKFAFLISIPSILGSFLLELPDAIAMGTQGVAFGPVLVGMLVAAVSGYAAIKAMIRAVVANKLTIFSGYTWALGAFVVIYGLFIA